jgi:succinyl-CoA synthetase beta subunit
MKIHEYQAQELFASLGIPVPPAKVATTPNEAKAIANDLAASVVIKAQVLSGGRGKAGGVKLALTSDEAQVITHEILGTEIQGQLVEKVLVALAVDIVSEIYLGAIVDRQTHSILLMASAHGGVDIEETAGTNPGDIIKVAIDPNLGLASHQARAVGFALGLEWSQVKQFGSIATRLTKAVIDLDATTAEINPLVVTSDGSLSAIDAKITIDDSALFRHPELLKLRNLEEDTGPEREARDAGISYVKLGGNIGCMVNGAGLAMALLDVIQLHGGEPANFLDVGGGANADQVRLAMEIILADQAVDLVLVNIFGGITRCDDVALGVVDAQRSLKRKVPLVVRLVGTNEEQGLEILRKDGIIAHRDMVDAVVAAVAGVSQ